MAEVSARRAAMLEALVQSNPFARVRRVLLGADQLVVNSGATYRRDSEVWPNYPTKECVLF